MGQYPLVVTDFADPLDTSSGIPYDLFTHLRREAPVWRTESGVWFFSLFDDVLAATNDIESFKSSFRDPGVIVPDEEQLISEIAEPRHGKIRRIVNSAIAAHRRRSAPIAMTTTTRRIAAPAIRVILRAPVASTRLLKTPSQRCVAGS